jgi:hypothetical protein
MNNGYNSPNSSSMQSSTNYSSSGQPEQTFIEKYIMNPFKKAKDWIMVDPATPNNVKGGRRTRRRIKGGDVATNAAPVYGLQVATPSYWISGKGGKRTKRRKNKKQKKSRRHR